MVQCLWLKTWYPPVSSNMAYWKMDHLSMISYDFLWFSYDFPLENPHSVGDFPAFSMPAMLDHQRPSAGLYVEVFEAQHGTILERTTIATTSEKRNRQIGKLWNMAKTCQNIIKQPGNTFLFWLGATLDVDVVRDSKQLPQVVHLTEHRNPTEPLWALASADLFPRAKSKRSREKRDDVTCLGDKI